MESVGRLDRKARGRQIPQAVKVSRAAAALSVGRSMEAAMQARQILQENPNQLGALEVLAKALWRTGQVEELLAVVDQMTALNPYEPGYQAMRGSALQTLGRYGEAAEAFKRCPDVPGSREALANIHAWQQGLIQDLAATDPVFRAHFLRSPQEACAARGFKLAGAEQVANWRPEEERAWVYTRPS